jgi:hypothetical protein
MYSRFLLGQVPELAAHAGYEIIVDHREFSARQNFCEQCALLDSFKDNLDSTCELYSLALSDELCVGVGLLTFRGLSIAVHQPRFGYEDQRQDVVSCAFERNTVVAVCHDGC